MPKIYSFKNNGLCCLFKTWIPYMGLENMADSQIWLDPPCAQKKIKKFDIDHRRVINDETTENFGELTG